MRRLLLVAALGIAACGGDGTAAGDVRWDGEPRVFAHPTLRDDRVLQGTIRNDSLRSIRLESARLAVLTEDGRELRASGAFLAGYAHALMPRNRGDELPDHDAARLGRTLVLRPGATAPLNVAWRGPGRAVAVRWGTGTLPLR